MSLLMDHPFPKSVTGAEKRRRLLEVVNPEDTLGVLIDADPDSMASALALKRFFWRKARKVAIFRINTIQRADNLAFIKLLKIDQKHIRYMRKKDITKWALLDSQPDHHDEFRKKNFDIIIDHHPVLPSSRAFFLDIKEDYGANSTIMTEYLKAAGIRPSPRLATALFYGIKTDTDNFVREALLNDINAFQYLYRFANMNIIKKIEFSEITKKMLISYQLAMERLIFVKDTAFIHMGDVETPDVLVIMADFFMRLAEATWSIVSGVYDNKLIVILRNAGFRGNAGKTAKKLFSRWRGSGGGHSSAGRTEVPLEKISKEITCRSDLGKFVRANLKAMK